MNRKTQPVASRLWYRAAIGAIVLLPITGCARDAAPPAAMPRVITADPLPAANQAAIGRLFTERALMGETRALLILRDGVPVYEAYGAEYTANSKLISWSMAKSITSVLIGLLVADGRLVLDDPAPVPAWQRPGDPRGNITLRHLLHMTSGLEHLETADPPWDADTVAMLFGTGAPNMAAMAEGKPPVAQPDEVFNYSSSTSVILSDIIARALTSSTNPSVRRDAVRAFIAGRLSGPLGMTSLTPEFDASGTMIGGSIMHATARDYAKFGEFLRNRGETPTGQRLVPDSWISFMLAPSPANGGYGGHIWLNRVDQRQDDQPWWPRPGPADLFACLGHQGQFIIVSPGRRLTVVRLGISTDGEQVPNVTMALQQAMAGL